MTASNIRASGTKIFSRRPPWNAYILAHPILRRLMGFAVLKHTGRRSGRLYATPVGAQPTATGFVVPLTFGENVDWFRNALAAGGCVIEWRGGNYRLIDPQVVSLEVALPAFNLVKRLLILVVGIKQYAHFRYAPAGDENADPQTALPTNMLSR